MAPVNILSQTTAKTFEAKHINLANGVVRRVKENVQRGIMHHQLDLERLRMVVFTDSSFANNRDSTTQLGFMILLTDGTGRANLLHFSSYKSKRIVRSVLGGETYAFADGFDAAYMLRYDLERMLMRRIPMTMLTDSESLFRVIIKASVTTEKRLMIDVRAAREAYQRGDISNVGWIRSAHNLADGLTKFEKNKLMVEFLESGRVTTVVEQWVIRAEVADATDDDNDSREMAGNYQGVEKVRDDGAGAGNHEAATVGDYDEMADNDGRVDGLPNGYDGDSLFPDKEDSGM